MARNETKREKFVRIAEARTNKIISMIQLLGNCSSQSSYEYTDKDVSDIFCAIERELKATKVKFNSSGDKSSMFKLTR